VDNGSLSVNAHPAAHHQRSVGEEGRRAMDHVHDDRFLVFVRLDPTLVETVPEALEQPVAACSSYGEASRIRRFLRGTATGECVIRFIGSSGGGD
jgi:hypothetical protein